MFLKIENAVSTIPDIELLTTLGASSSRYTERIGQFGSGTLYAIALSQRLGYKIKICMGLNVYTVFTKVKTVTDSFGDRQTIETLWLKKQNGGSINLNIDVNFGIMDWHDIDMALREFISNAIDGADGDYNKVLVEATPQDRAKDGTIRIYIDMDNSVRDYYNNLGKHFLGFHWDYDPAQRIIENNGEMSQFYRKGVKVGESPKPGLFNYNIPTFDLKESRIVDSYEAKQKAAEELTFSSVPTIVKYLRSFDNTYWEHDFSGYDLRSGNYSRSIDQDSRADKNWESAYRQVYGDSVLCESSISAKIVQDKGYTPLLLHDTLADVFKYLDVRKAKDILTADEISGKTIIEPSREMTNTLDRVWGLLIKHGMTEGKTKPEVKGYHQVDKAEGNSLGYYRMGGNTVYIRTDVGGLMLIETMIEEIAHYVTQARDMTREFQSFAFRLAASLATAPVETPTAPVETPTAPVETPTAPVETPTAPVETPTAPVETPTAPVTTEWDFV